MFKEIFKKFPGLHSEMLAESFSRYIKEFRKPVGKQRLKTIQSHNKRSAYSKIQAGNNRDEGFGNMRQTVTPGSQKLQRSNSRTKIFEKQEELKQYKEQLDKLNDKAN